MKKILFTLLAVMMSTMMFAQEESALSKEVKTLPEVKVTDLDGESVSSADFENDGKPMIVSFWATWCKPCILELNTIRDVYEDWQEETGVKLIAISIDDARNKQRVKPFINGRDWAYEVYIDENQDLKRALNVVNVPHTFLINGDGEIVYQHTSYAAGDEEELYDHLLELVNDPAEE